MEGYVLRLKDRPAWVCKWTPSWAGDEAWATTGRIEEADRFPTVEEAKAFATKHRLLDVEVWRFGLTVV